MSSTFIVPSTATYKANSQSKHFTAGDVIPLETAVKFAMVGAADRATAEITLEKRVQWWRATWLVVPATAVGWDIGVIPEGTQFVRVESDDATKSVTLPRGVHGVLIAISNGATGYRLRTADPAEIGINGEAGEGAYAAIPAYSTLEGALEGSTWVIAAATDDEDADSPNLIDVTVP